MTQPAFRAVACLGASLIAAAGCQPSYRDVHVDIDRILAQTRPPDPPRFALPSPPAALPSQTITIPGQPAETIRDPSHASRGAVEARAEIQQRDALQRLEVGLRAIDATKAQAFRLAQEQALGKTESSENAELIDRLEAAFTTYAAARRPKVLRFAVIVGYPDPNPTSIPPRGNVPLYVQNRFEEAKRIRSELAALDQGFDATAHDLIARTKNSSEDARARMTARIVAYRADLDHQAALLAAREVPTSARMLGLRLVEPTPVRLASTSEEVVTIPGASPPPAPPQVPSEQISRSPADRRRELGHELSIWLALNRYRQSPDGREATKEFQEWRQTYRSGL